MEQLYYTQCPIGYGLGASNGFQIKRMTAGYPVATDFRHLGLRAFPGGGRTLAPSVLRYRLDGPDAEVARLTPRAQEYQTERGLWGRPGGVFAHAVRFHPDELGSFGAWPAAWLDAPDWRTNDPEPTRGRPPDEVDLARLGSFRSADFAAAPALFDGLDPDWLARAWTALAQVTREGRTLFLLDAPDRLAPLVAALTLGFPAALRVDLTFSTFHDRPEELPGYRIQGTSPVVRPNRPALLAQGIIADRTAGAFEPPVEAAEWATTLAEWWTRREAIDEADWSATESRARAARAAETPVEQVWADAWLGPLIGFPASYRDRSRPGSPAGWLRLAHFGFWSGTVGLADEWVRPRGPDWWLLQASDGAALLLPEARRAFVVNATLRDAWRAPESASGWGRAAGAWYGGPATPPTERLRAVAALFNAAPRAARPAFAQALIRSLGPELGAAALGQLRALPGSDGALLLPLEVGVAAARLAQLAESDAGDDRASALEVADQAALLGRLLRDAAEHPGLVSAALDAVADASNDRSNVSLTFYSAARWAFGGGSPDGGREALAWALRRDDGANWLAPALRPGLADPDRGALLDNLRDRTPDDLRGRLARAVLAVADDPGLPDDAFRLAVERLVLPLAPRPHRATWAETYLRRTPSTWDLFRRLYSKESAALGVPSWLDGARGRGELSAEQAARLDATRLFARSLGSGDPRSLLDAPLPDATATDRPLFLRQLLARLGGGAGRAGLPFVLDACRTAWPGAFRAEAPGLAALARPLAEFLGSAGDSPRRWFDDALAVIDRLGLRGATGETGGPGPASARFAVGFEPGGLLAEWVAALPEPTGGDPWPLRQFLFEHDDAWPTLARVLRRDLDFAEAGSAPELVDRWDSRLAKTSRPGLVPRFWELILNVADPARRAAIVAARARDLQTVGPLPWWGHARVAGAVDDLRDAYARTSPLDPIPEGRTAEVDRWLAGRPRPAEDDPNAPIRVDEPEPEAEATLLSDAGRARWLALRALTEFGPRQPHPSSRVEELLAAWEARGLTRAFVPNEVYRLASWIILGIDPTDPPDRDRMAAWLVRAGVADWRRVGQWAEELPPGVADGPAQMNRARFVGDLGRELRTLLGEARESSRREG